MPLRGVAWKSRHVEDILGKTGSEQTSSPEQLLDGAAPIEVWVQFIWLDGPPKDGARTIGVITIALMPFIGREIEFLPAPLHPRVIADRLTGTILYLLRHGLVVSDGDSLGTTESEQIHVRYRPAGQRYGIPVLQLEAKQGVLTWGQ